MHLGRKAESETKGGSMIKFGNRLSKEISLGLVYLMIYFPMKIKTKQSGLFPILCLNVSAI